MNQKEYIQNVLIDEIGDIVSRHAFLSFGLITSGIELLGILIDEKNNFFQKDKSGERFRAAIDKLFPREYSVYNDIGNTKRLKYDLYSELRCGLNHGTIPKTTIGLSERKYGEKHLSIRKDGLLVLVVENFYDDFRTACHKVIDKIDSGEIRDKFALNLV